MFYLVLVSLIWAFSFGLIKKQLVTLDPSTVAVARIALAAVVFLPFLKWTALEPRRRIQLAVTGAVQFGIMYLLYQRSFIYLKAYEVVLFTLTTPLLLIFIDASLDGRLNLRHFTAALLSVVGGGVVIWRKDGFSPALHGLVLVQLSNVCFAVGQLAYRRLRRGMAGVPDHTIFGWLYLGALVVTATVDLPSGGWRIFAPTAEQWGVLVYLGVLSSGLCFFWWNLGATRVNAGTLAAMNNAKLPLGVAVSLLFFGEAADPLRLLLGGGLLAAGVVLAESTKASPVQ